MTRLLFATDLHLRATRPISRLDPDYLGTLLDKLEQIRVMSENVDLVLLGGDIFDLSTKCIAPGGRLLVVGFTSGRIPSVAANRILLKNISIVGAFWGRHILENETWIQSAQRELNDLYTGGKIRPAPPMTFPLEKAPEALQCIADRKVKGKIALTIAATI